MQTRRYFIVTVGSGLVIGFFMPSRFLEAAAKTTAPFIPNAFLRIAPDDSITVIAKHDEMGQGVHTSLAMEIADELGADFSKVRTEPAPADDAYKHAAFGLQMTGGSTSTWSSFEQMRKAGATAREMLIAAAAQRWKVEPSSCHTDKGFVVHGPSKRRLRFGELVEAATKLPVPTDVKLKDAKDFTIIGKPT